MGLFSKKNTIDTSLDPRNPAALFSLVGLDMMWNEIARAENKAVDTYKQYIEFKKSLKQKYPRINFERALEIKNTYGDPIDFPFKATSGIVMYLKAIDAHDTFLVTEQDNEEDDYNILSYEEYRAAIRGLNKEESQYSDSMREYIDNNIRVMVEEAAEDIMGINPCHSPIPINTQPLVDYHKFIANDIGIETSSFSNENKERWKSIGNAPLFRFDYSLDRYPLIPISIDYLDAFILDWLCYATMYIPTTDTRKVLYYKRENGESVKEGIISTYGDNAFKLINTTLEDLNCSAFRSFVRQELKLEEAKDRDQVLKYMEQF